MKHFPLIGILVPLKKDRIKILKLYQPHCGEDLKLRLCSFTPAAVSLKKQTVTSIADSAGGWKEVVHKLPDAVYNRCYNKSAKKLRTLEAMLGKKCFNTITHFNKWVVYTLLEQSTLKIYLPETFIYDANMLPSLLEAWRLMYLKPVYGNRGRNVRRLELTESGNVLISLHSLAPRYICRKNEDIRVKLEGILGAKKFIMQKGIRSSRVGQCFFDLRVLVQKNIDGNWMVSAAACRVAYDDFFNTGIFKGIYDAEILFSQLFNRKTGLKLLHKLNDISIGAAEVLDKRFGLLGELSVDFILDENAQPWIIEVNGKPQKSIYKNVEDFQYKDLIYQRPLEYAYYLSQLPPVR